MIARVASRLAVASFLTACAASAASANEPPARKLSVGGYERVYLLSNAAPGTPRPAIIVLHGGGMSANSGMRSTGFEPLIARENLVAIYPNAFRREWNDGREARLKARENSDDVGFMRALVKSLIDEKIADPKRIYVTGASNGGMMSLRLICEAAELFAAAAPIIANLPSDIAGGCKPSRAVPVLVINGTADPLVPYKGGGVGFAGRRGNVISTDATMARLRRFNGCSDAAKTERLPDIDFSDGSTVTVNSWTDCTSGAPVVLYRVDGGGHRIPHKNGTPMPMIDRMLGKENHDFDSPEVIWAFFRGKRL
jgi:polyhydroxybutyrate depolymerase